MTSLSRCWRQSYTFLLIATLLVVASADYFLYDARAVGWTASIVAAAMLAVLALRDTRFLGSFGGRIVWLATMGLILALIEQPTWLNVTYLLVCFSGLALTNAQGWENDFARWLGRWARWAATGWARVFFDNGLAMRWLVRRGLSPRTARGLAAWMLPVLLSSVFVLIFAWANPIISGWFAALGRLIGRLIVLLPELLNIGRIFFWVAFAAVAWALLRSRTGKATTPVASRTAAEIVNGKLVIRDRRAADGIPAGLVVRCLVLFNLIFAVELALDLYVLLSGQYGSDGAAFKTYVRRGAYPLVAAALLAGLFVLITFRSGSQTERSRAARALVYAWIGQTILLMVSAMWRLHRYVELTEMTRLRVASIIWFLLVALGLLYIIRRIVGQRSNAWLINVNALTALIALYPCCFINFDGIIADFNARHCEEAGGVGSPLDIEYFRTLGTPALAALDSVRDQIPIKWRREHAEEISRELHAKLEADMNDWRAWTWRKQRSTVEVAEQLARSRQRRQIAHATPPRDAIQRP